MSNEVGKDPAVAVISDNMLIERLGQGDISSFETIFYRHYDRVYGLLFRLLGSRQEAEDVTQEVFLKLYSQSFDRRRDHNLSAWLYRVATNMGYNHIRSRQRRWSRDKVLVPDNSEGQGDPVEAAAKSEDRDRVRAALAQLPERQTQMLLLRQMGFSYAELAGCFDLSPSSVGTLLARASEAFRKVYEGDLPGGK